METISNVWAQIAPDMINSVLGSEYLEILEPLLGRLPEDVPLKDDRVEKAQIYKMSVLSKLSIEKFRRELFAYFSNDELRAACKLVGIPVSSATTAIAKLAAIPWVPGIHAEKLADFLGVPKFILEVSSSSDSALPTQVLPWMCKYDHVLNPILEDRLREEFSGRKVHKTLKAYQAIAHQQVGAQLLPNFGKCLLNMPTGTGKTRTAMEVVCSYLIEHPDDCVVWIAPSRELLDQATLEFAQVWEYLGDRRIDIHRRGVGRRENLASVSQFVVTSFQTLLNDAESYRSTRVGLVIVDEAHMTLAEKWSKAVVEITQPSTGTRVLGLTATPVRGDSVDTKRLAQFYNNNLVQITVPNSQPLFEYLVNQGILARPVYETIPGDTIAISKSKIKGIVQDYDEIPLESLIKLAKSGSRNLAIVEKLREVLGSVTATRQILFFGVTVEHSKMIATWLLKQGYSAFHLDATVPASTRTSCINAFRSGKLRVLCNYGVLSTGFDVPRVDCVFIARPTTSHVLHSQMVGRGLRGPLIGGTSSCLIIEVEDNFENFGNDQKLSFKHYLEMWSS